MSQEIEKIKEEILERDRKDLAMDQEVRTRLLQEGFIFFKPLNFIEIDGGRIDGVENVVDEIKKRINGINIRPEVISVEGLSGVGKSSTARVLAEKLGGVVFSAGEIFRFLTFRKLSGENVEEIISELSYFVVDKEIVCLYRDQEIAKTFARELRTEAVNKEVPNVAKTSQGIVLRFIKNEIERLKRNELGSRAVVVEGRAFFLDFLFSDLRVRIVADIETRAKRRLVVSPRGQIAFSNPKVV